MVTVRKLIGHDIFGIEKYFPARMESKVITVSRSSQKRQLVEVAHRFAAELGVSARFVDLFCTATEEMVTNAIYNAPVDAQGANRYLHYSRQDEVVLAEEEQVEVKLACDGAGLGISVADPFGSLTKERLLGYLAKCLRRGPDQVDTKKGGAGVGLYFLFQSLSQFIVNISPGKRTEMIGILDISGSYKNFATQGRSFNLFVGRSL